MLRNGYVLALYVGGAVTMDNSVQAYTFTYYVPT